jgi:glycogen operon protein
MPKSRVIDPAFTWGEERRPNIPWEQTILYEAHARGFTMRHPTVPEPYRGTFAGLMHHDVVDYIRKLGVTALELLPTHAFVDDDYLVQKGRRNYWGYNTIGFFAPQPRYLSGPNVNEFKEMVAQYHRAGIEIILDVVYNHTAEGNELGPTLSFKGIDNASYYRLAPDRRYYINGHRHGQHGQPEQSARIADGGGFPPVLGVGNASRWIPLRPCDDTRPRAARFRRRGRFS